MELSRNEFIYENGISNNDIDYMVGLIIIEIKSIYKIKNRIRKFAYMEAKNGNINSLKFNSLIDEVSRMMVEISVLEQKKIEYINIKEFI